jgi:hypothetical protein
VTLPDGHPGAYLAAEREGINLYSEHSLHDQVKRYLAEPGDRMEAAVDGRVADLLKADGSVVEVQTRNLAALVPKVRALVASGRHVCVVHPIPVTRVILRKDPGTGRQLSVRKSPKRGDKWSVFDELVKASALIALPGVSVEALLVRVTETRVRDGTGSWRRRGDRTEDRSLDAVEGAELWETPADWLALIPPDLSPPWSSESLGLALGLPPPRARKVLYCLARAGLLAEAGRVGRRKTYALP